MPRTSPTPRHPARRALLDDVRDNKRGWLQHGAAALAVSVLGLGVAGSFALTGNAQNTTAGSHTDAVGTSVSAAREGAALTSRSSIRTPLDQARVRSLADQRAEELAKTDDQITAAAAGQKVDQRDKKLAETSKKASKQARRLARERVAAAKARAARAKAASTAGSGSTPRPRSGSARTHKPAAQAPARTGGRGCMPAAHYRVAATFGQVGAWARYHTGFDFAAPVGTTLRAPGPGVVTNAGQGNASGWAGNYVAIKYSDGTQSLMAHMSTVSVRVGQNVSACQVVGAVGMTGRTFGPHVHFEIYPPGVTPGDVYRAVNPLSWLRARGLNP